MGHQATLTRKRVVEHAQGALDKARECVDAVNNQARRFEAHERRFSQHELDNNRAFTALKHEVETLGRALRDAKADLARRDEAFQQMGLIARLRWLLTGHTPSSEPTSAGYDPPL